MADLVAEEPDESIRRGPFPAGHNIFSPRAGGPGRGHRRLPGTDPSFPARGRRRRRRQELPYHAAAMLPKLAGSRASHSSRDQSSATGGEQDFGRPAGLCWSPGSTGARSPLQGLAGPGRFPATGIYRGDKSRVGVGRGGFLQLSPLMLPDAAPARRHPEALSRRRAFAKARRQGPPCDRFRPPPGNLRPGRRPGPARASPPGGKAGALAERHACAALGAGGDRSPPPRPRRAGERRAGSARGIGGRVSGSAGVISSLPGIRSAAPPAARPVGFPAAAWGRRPGREEGGKNRPPAGLQWGRKTAGKEAKDLGSDFCKKRRGNAFPPRVTSTYGTLSPFKTPS